MAHERVHIPSRGRRAPGRVLRWDDYTESLPRVKQGLSSIIQQRLAALQPLGGIPHRVVVR